jgi:DsbC/DsbD-like thiol-disulfide interchange protein
MKRRLSDKLFAALFLLALAALLQPAMPATKAASAPAPQGGNIGINGFFSVDPAAQGTSFQAAIVLDIPRGLHVNANKPLGKYAVPTTIKIDAPRGMKITPLTYPAAQVRTFRFGGGAAERLAVYEGRSIARFNVTVPPNFDLGVARIRVSVRFQSCSDEVCFPPATRELVLPIAIVNRGSAVNRINQIYFGSGRRRR